MANVAFSKSEDLLFGSGELYISIDGDDTGWRHLGNADEFTITTTLQDVEKYGSMDKKRELQSRSTTQVSIIASAVLTEYDSNNLAMALFGDTETKTQKSIAYTNETLKIDKIPSIITVNDPDGNRCFGLLDISMSPKTDPYPCVYWVNDRGFGDLTTDVSYNDTFIAHYMGGKIKIDMSDAVISKQFPIYVNISEAPKYAGDLLDMRVQVFDGSDGSIEDVKFTSRSSETIKLNSNIEITFSVDGYHTFGVMSPSSVRDGIKALAIPYIDKFEDGVDYIVSEQSSRAGMVKIPPYSRIRAGDEVYASCIVPEKDLQVVHGGANREITGKLLYVPDNNAGPNYVLEAWKVHIKPDGDLSGLISDGDFGSYNINFVFLTDYEKHPESPYYSMTLVDYPNNFINSGKYDSGY